MCGRTLRVRGCSNQINTEELLSGSSFCGSVGEGRRFSCFFPSETKSAQEEHGWNFYSKDIKYSENMIKYVKIVLLFMEMHDKMMLDNVNEKKGVEDERTVIG